MIKRTKKNNNAFNDPQKGFNDATKRIVFLIIVAILIVIAGTYFIVTYKYGSFANMFLGETTVASTKQTVSQTQVKKVDGKRNILIAMSSAGGTEVYDIFIVHINLTDNKTVISSLPVNTSDSNGKTLYDEFSLGSVTQVKYCIEKMFGIKFDKYFCATQNGYKYLLTELSEGITYTIPEDIQFSTTDFTVSVEKGKQFLKFDSFLKLLRYPDWSGAENQTFLRQSQMLSEAYKQLFITKNITRDVNKFSDMMTYIKSDLSAENYVSELDALEYIAASNFSVSQITPKGTFSSNSSNAGKFVYSHSSLSEIKYAFS